MHAWHIIVKRLRRLPALASFQYLWVVEATKRGEPHLHVLLRAPWIHQWMLSEWMAELARSPIVHIERITRPRQVVNYVAKYVAKEPARFGNSKRYFASRDYELEAETVTEKHPSAGPGWQLDKRTLRDVVYEYSGFGWIELYDVMDERSDVITLVRGP